MIDNISYFTKYIGEYIEKLAGGKSEFFLSICDIEEDMLDMVNVSALSQYHVVIVNNKDYSQAVKLRNNVEVSCIVLLSGEGVKQIDSLKDFNEYSILNLDREIIWDCMEKVFNIEIEAKVKVFLDAILEKDEISFWELWCYLQKAGIQQGLLQAKELNKNLPMLGIWKSNNTDICKKAQIERMIRLSKYAIVENRLTKAIMENKLSARNKVNLVTKELAEGSIQKILEGMYFEEIEDILKNPPRNISNGESEMNEIEEGIGIEENSKFSYEYLMNGATKKTVLQLEEEWLQNEDGTNEESRKEVSKAKKDRELESVKIAWEKFNLGNSIYTFEASFKEVQDLIFQLNLPMGKINDIDKLFQDLWCEFREKQDVVLKSTPICISTFCRAGESYTQYYFKLLSYLITEESVRYAVAKTGLIHKLQNLWCVVGEHEIKMPFYHPICIFYYMGLREIYEYVLKKWEYTEEKQSRSQILESIIKKLGMQFPVDFLKNGEQLYALDRTTIWKSSYITFHNVNRGIVYSALDFGSIYSHVLDYICSHPFMTEIIIALVDISELNGIHKLVSAIRNIAEDKKCNVGHVTFLILSYKEEELKSNLSQIWENMDTGDVVRFRFGRDNYWGKESDGDFHYNLSGIVDEADMTIIADGSVLYHEPRLVKLQQGGNSLYKRLERFDAFQQIELYFKNGRSDISVLWDTLQHIEEGRDDGLWYRKSKELDNNILNFINRVIDEKKEKYIVAISSNEHILSEIYKTDYLQAHRQKHNGKSITIMKFGQKDKDVILKETGIAKLTYFLNDFYNTTLELDDFSKGLVSDSNDICVEITYDNGIMKCDCSIYVEDVDKQDQEEQKGVEEFLEWQFKSFLSDENILTAYFSDFLLNHYFEKARNIPAVLLAERIYRGHEMKTTFRQVSKEELQFSDDHEYGQNCMEQVKIHEMIQFIDGKEVIDEYTITQFKEFFSNIMLDRILNCNEVKEFLQIGQINKLEEIQKKIRGN